jgi:hypothetical protein
LPGACRKDQIGKPVQLLTLTDGNIDVDDEICQMKYVAHTLTIVILFLIFVELYEFVSFSFVFVDICTLVIPSYSLGETGSFLIVRPLRRRSGLPRLLSLH